MRKKLAILIPLAVLIIFGQLVMFLPRAIRSYVEGNYPVKVGRVHLGWPVRFEDVQVNLDDTHAELREVRATPFRSDPIEVSGGSVHIVRKKGQEKVQVPSGGRTLILRGLQVTLEAEEFLVELEGVDLGSSYSFKKGTLTIDDGRVVHLVSGTISKNLQEVALKSAEVEIALPFDLPKFPSRGILQVEDVKANRSTKSADIGSITYGPVKATHVHVAKGDKTEVTLKTVVVNHPWVALEPVTFQDVLLDLLPPFEEIGIRVGLVQLQVHPKDLKVSGYGACSDLISALPDERPDALKVPPENLYGGTVTFGVELRGHGKVDLEYTCKYTCSEEPIKSLKAGRIRYMAYNSKRERFERTVSRDSTDWAEIAKVPPYVPKAFVTLEDPGFLGHRGIIVQALQNSLKDNLTLGKFFRGGSTITQQLAKNLWLNRSKTISRKVYEAILAMSLESCLSKQEILELYMNVVEFGPDLYGIGPATKRYFNKEVGDISLDEGFYLAALLPHPSRAIPPDHGGLEAAKKLMAHLVSGGLLPDVYLPEDGEVNSAGWQTSE